jgi:hypothetical protein
MAARKKYRTEFKQDAISLLTRCVDCWALLVVATMAIYDEMVTGKSTPITSQWHSDFGKNSIVFL